MGGQRASSELCYAMAMVYEMRRRGVSEWEGLRRGEGDGAAAWTEPRWLMRIGVSVCLGEYDVCLARTKV